MAIHTECPLFRVKRPPHLPDSGVRTYWVESTAAANVDDPPPVVAPGEIDAIGLVGLDAAVAITELTQHLSDSLQCGKEPEIVVTIHGFNSPEPGLKAVTPVRSTMLATNPGNGLHDHNSD